jgi:prepilin-type N-terminal cleavage/methylation domain-containing protein
MVKPAAKAKALMSSLAISATNARASVPTFMIPARTIHSSKPIASRRGFTLIELIVVVVVLGIAAAAIVPKFTGTARQEADNSVDQVAELLRLFAYRQSLSSQQVALWRDGNDGRIHLLVMDIDPEEPDAPPAWRPDRFAAPVSLPLGVEIVEIQNNDQRVDPAEWTISSVPGGERPKIAIRLVGLGIDSTVALPQGSPSVVRVDADKPAPFAREPIDLNRAGREFEPW